MQNQEICRKIRCYLYRAELNVHVCLKIQEFLENKRPYSTKEKFLVMTSNNAFNDAILTIKSLLGPNRKEISLLKLGTHIPDLDKIREEFEEHSFSAIRNKIIAHKDKSTKYDGTEHVQQLVNSEHPKKLSEIVEKLNKLVYEHFEIRWDQNNPHANTLKGLNEILEMIK
ncbi:hypothetical protein JKY72_03990 [Candidatus Gracilibacteria bacterium]|nr:hypothetical protein [Candidatus Gracilibacteria bacterium]